MKATRILLLMAFCGLLISPAKAQVQSDAPHKVVMQLDSDRQSDLKSTLGRIEALKTGWGEEVDIQLVVNGDGLDLLTSSSKYADQIAELQKLGVVFTACRKSMMMRALVPSDMLEGVTFVQLGAKEVILKQESGWTYYRN